MPVLEINDYSEQGELRETGFWTHDKQGSGTAAQVDL